MEANFNVEWTASVVRIGAEDDSLGVWLNKSLKIHRGTNWYVETFWLMFYHPHWCSLELFSSCLSSCIYFILCYFTLGQKNVR